MLEGQISGRECPEATSLKVPRLAKAIDGDTALRTMRHGPMCHADDRCSVAGKACGRKIDNNCLAFAGSKQPCHGVLISSTDEDYKNLVDTIQMRSPFEQARRHHYKAATGSLSRPVSDAIDARTLFPGNRAGPTQVTKTRCDFLVGSVVRYDTVAGIAMA